MINKLKEFFSIIASSSINFINSISSISSFNPTSQLSYYKYNL